MPLPRASELGLSEEQLLLRRTVREFAREKVAPRAHALDAAQSFPAESWAEAAELGLLGATAPTEHGGAGLGLIELCVIGEELAAACVSTAATVLHQAEMVVGRIARRIEHLAARQGEPGRLVLHALALEEPRQGRIVGDFGEPAHGKAA